MFFKARGCADLPITISGNLLVVAALLQAVIVSSFLFILNPVADDSSLEAKL